MRYSLLFNISTRNFGNVCSCEHSKDIQKSPLKLQKVSVHETYFGSDRLEGKLYRFWKNGYQIPRLQPLCETLLKTLLCELDSICNRLVTGGSSETALGSCTGLHFWLIFNV